MISVSLDCVKDKPRGVVVQHRRLWRGERATNNLKVEWLRVNLLQVKSYKLQGIIKGCYHVKLSMELKLDLDLSLKERAAETLSALTVFKTLNSLGKQSSFAAQVG